MKTSTNTLNIDNKTKVATKIKTTHIIIILEEKFNVAHIDSSTSNLAWVSNKRRGPH